MNTVRATVVNEPLIAVRANGQRLTFQLVISAPYQTQKGDDRVWGCNVSLQPLHQSDSGVFRGSTPFLALCEAVAFANGSLKHVVDEGGKILLPSGAEFRMPAVIH